MQPTFYAVTLLQGASERNTEHHRPKDVKVRKVQEKKSLPVKKESPKTPKKVAALKPETAQAPQKKKAAAPSQKEKPKERSKDVALNYKDVQSAIAQIHQKQALESVKESVAEIQKKLMEEKEDTEKKRVEPDQESEDVPDERVISSFQGYDSRKGELYRTQLWSLIHSQWSISEAGLDRRKDLEARIVMHLAKDGSIQDVKLVKSSGDLMFDNSALLAIKRVGQFPPFPLEISLESEEFEVSFIPQEN